MDSWMLGRYVGTREARHPTKQTLCFLEAINSYEFCWLLIRIEIFGVLA